MKKRLLALVLTICTLSVMLCACSEENKKDEAEKQSKTDNQQTTSTTSKEEPKEEPASENLPGWAKLYTDFIVESNSDSNGSDRFYGFNYIGINDLNFDGTPELILSDDAASAAYSLAIFYIKDGSVKRFAGGSCIADAAEMHSVSEDTDIAFYSNFEDNWLTLRKNVNTGEMRYVMYTWNGASNESFGNITGFSSDENGEIKMVNEFDYLIFYDDNFEVSDTNYSVSGKAVTEEEYKAAEEEFEKTWVDTGIRPLAMAHDLDEYSNKIPVSTERKDLEAFFGKYEKEY